MQLEARTGPSTDRWALKLPPLWTVGLILYAAGVLISLYTGDLKRFLLDYPWACFSVVYMIGAWVGPYFTERHRMSTISIRNAFSVSDEEFEEVLGSNMRRLTQWRNVLFGLIFLPTLLWAWTQRLWWQGYNRPFFFDLYYLLILALMFPIYASLMFGAAFACNFNVYKLCEKIPIDSEYLLDEGQPILRRSWGDLVEKAMVVTLIMSALTNVPILLYSGEMRSFLNLGLALALTTLIFLVPHYMFHKMLERAKDEMLSRVLRLRGKLGFGRLEELSRSTSSERKTDEMLNLIYLTQYERSLRSRSTWLVDLKAVAELLAAGSVHVVFLELLTRFMHS